MKNCIPQKDIFNFKWFSKFINCWFFKGQSYKIEKLVFNSFFFIKKILNVNGLLLLFEVLEQLKPLVGLKISRNNKQKKSHIKAYPKILTTKTQYRKSIYWLIKSIQIRKEINFYIRISNEIKNVIFCDLTSSLKKKKEYYNYAILFKSVHKYKWN